MNIVPLVTLSLEPEAMEPNVKVSCFPANCVWILLVTPSKYANSVVVIALSESLPSPFVTTTIEFDKLSVTTVVAAPVIVACLFPNAFVMVVEKLALLSRAAASSFNVSKASGAEPTKLETAVWTKAVVAICVVLVPEPAVGAVGVPVNAGLAFVA